MLRWPKICQREKKKKKETGSFSFTAKKDEKERHKEEAERHKEEEERQKEEEHKKGK
mgnify:CR=1 FL=1